MQALRNTFSSRLRTQSRRPRTVAPPLEDTAPDQRSTAQPDRAAEMNEVFSAIGELPEDFRLALVAVDILGLSYQEAATALGTREATITTRLSRARQRIAREFTDGGPGGPPGSKATTESQPQPEKPNPGREGNHPNRSLA
jgi:RNA polymerase sigma-70 factor (ECF subfamily)